MCLRPQFILLLLIPFVSWSQTIPDSFYLNYQAATTGSEKAKAAYFLADQYRFIQQDSAEKYVNLALSYASEAQDVSEEIYAHRLKARINMDMNQYDESVKSTVRAIELCEQINDKKLLGKSYMTLALTYKKMGDVQKMKDLTRKGKEYAEQAEAIFREINDSQGLMHIAINKGIILRDLEDNEGARKSYEAGLAVQGNHKEIDVDKGLLNANLGQIIIDTKGNLDSAIAHLEKAIDYYQISNYQRGLEHAHRNLALAYSKKGNHLQAKEYAKISIGIAEKLGDKHRLFNAYGVQRVVNVEAGDYKTAFESLEKEKAYEDSTLQTEKLQSLADIEAKYQTEKKELEIAALDEKTRLQQKQLWWVLGGLLLALSFLAYIFWQNRKIRENRKQIENQSEKLKLMMKELHHRVKNNLAIVSSLLSIQSSKLKDEGASKAVKEGQMRVQAMSLLHQRLYKKEDVSTMDVNSYLTDLAESLMEAYGYDRDNFNLSIEVDQPELDVDLAIPIGLIVNELITNSFKYAYEGIDHPTLSITMKNGDDILLQVQDNGIGISSTDQKGDSFGQELIKGLSRQVRGQIKMENRNGTYFELYIPKAA